jgi:hypothetical protein
MRFCLSVIFAVACATSGAGDRAGIAARNAVPRAETRLHGRSATALQGMVRDAAGNLVFDGRLFYQYDGLNRLVRVSHDPNMTAGQFDPNTGRPPREWGGGSHVANFAFDGLGRLIQIVHSRKTAPNYTLTDHIYYDGVRRIQEVCGKKYGLFRPGSPNDPNGVVRDYVWGPGYVDEILAQVSRTGTATRTVYTYLQDASYNVAAILDPNLQTQRQYTYEPYGEVVFAETAGGDPNLLPVNRIGHQGLFFERFLLDPNDTFATPALDPNAVGVYLTRNRPYSPRLARWLSRDMNESAQPVVTALAMNGQTLGIVFGAFSALGHYGDGMNLYAYAGSNPVNRRDPLGLYYDPFEEADDIAFSIMGERAAAAASITAQVGMAFSAAQLIGGMAFSFLPGADAVMLAVMLAQGKEVSWGDIAMAGIGFAGPLGKVVGKYGGMVARYSTKGLAHALQKSTDKLTRWLARGQTDAHHLIPKFMGGWDEAGAKYRLPQRLHIEFHRSLRENLKAAGIVIPENAPRNEWAKFLSDPEQARLAKNVLLNTTEEFDRARGTGMLQNLLDEIERQGW